LKILNLAMVLMLITPVVVSSAEKKISKKHSAPTVKKSNQSCKSWEQFDKRLGLCIAKSFFPGEQNSSKGEDPWREFPFDARPDKMNGITKLAIKSWVNHNVSEKDAIRGVEVILVNERNAWKRFGSILLFARYYTGISSLNIDDMLKVSYANMAVNISLGSEESFTFPDFGRSLQGYPSFSVTAPVLLSKEAFLSHLSARHIALDQKGGLENTLRAIADRQFLLFWHQWSNYEGELAKQRCMKGLFDSLNWEKSGRLGYMYFVLLAEDELLKLADSHPLIGAFVVHAVTAIPDTSLQAAFNEMCRAYLASPALKGQKIIQLGNRLVIEYQNLESGEIVYREINDPFNVQTWVNGNLKDEFN
jgi:hypothetical protein